MGSERVHHAPPGATSLPSLIGNDIDFLFAHGDHSYNSVRADLENYARLVRPGGVIAFHDIVPGRAESVSGVPQLWREIRTDFESVEFVESWKRHRFGTGIVRTLEDTTDTGDKSQAR